MERIPVALWLVAAELAAQEPTPFAEARKAAEASEASQAGKGYLPSTEAPLEKAFQDVGDCIGAAKPKRSDLRDVALAVRLAGDGKVLEAVAERESAVPACFVKAVLGATFPAPPAADFWLLVRVELDPKRK